MESFKVNYKEFLNSLEENKIHHVCDYGFQISAIVSKPHYLLSTSGSTYKKYYVHSVDSIKACVSSFLKSHPLSKCDRWWVSLSTKHVAGFSILARSHFAGIREPFEEPFVLSLDKIEKEEITLLSLVPTQIFDIVSKALKAPEKLKYVFVGGAPLNQKLYQEAKALGWPLVPCFGSTETFAQFASSKDNVNYELYEDWDFRKNENEELEVFGPGLFTHELLETGELKKQKDSWCSLKDKVEVFGDSFSFVGKSDGLYKQKGLYKDFNKQKALFESVLIENKINPSKHLLVLLEEERSGASLYLVSSNIKESDLIGKKMPEVRGSYIFKDLNAFKGDIGKPLKLKIEDALLRPLLLI